MQQFLHAVGDFARQSRLMFLTCTVVPVAFGGALAYHDTGVLNWLLFSLTLLGVSAAHLGVNLANDYFDFRLGADRPETGQRPYSGGGDALTRDDVAPITVKRWFWMCFVAAAAIGALIFLLMEKGRTTMLAVAVLGFLGGYFYTAPPFKLAYRGLGELDIFLFLGPAPIIGTYVVLTGELSWRVFLLSMPIAGLIALLLWINQFTDAETDRAAGKRNLVVRLGKRRARWGYLLLNAFVFATVVYAVAADLVGAPFLLALLGVPLATRSVVRTIVGHNDDAAVRAAQADALLVHLGTGLLCSLGVLVGAFA